MRSRSPEAVIPRNAALVHAPARRLACNQNARTRINPHNRSRLMRHCVCAHTARFNFANERRQRPRGTHFAIAHDIMSSLCADRIISESFGVGERAVHPYFHLMHHTPLLATIAASFVVAFVLGMIAQRLSFRRSLGIFSLA